MYPYTKKKYLRKTKLTFFHFYFFTFTFHDILFSASIGHHVEAALEELCKAAT